MQQRITCASPVAVEVEGEPVPSLLWSFGGSDPVAAGGRLEESDIEHPDGVEFNLNIKHISEDEIGQGYAARELKIYAVIEEKRKRVHNRSQSF